VRPHQRASVNEHTHKEQNSYVAHHAGSARTHNDEAAVAVEGNEMRPTLLITFGYFHSYTVARPRSYTQ
jgi:hypothetical protein